MTKAVKNNKILKENKKSGGIWVKKFKLLLLTLISVFVLISCSSAPITGRQQLKFVDDEKLASESSAAYSNL